MIDFMPETPLEPDWIDRLYAFGLGMMEFRSDFTTHFDSNLIETYDAGRELAHKLTFRYFEH